MQMKNLAQQKPPSYLFHILQYNDYSLDVVISGLTNEEFTSFLIRNANI